MKCEQCKQEFAKENKIQHFDYDEPTTIHVFCSDKCKDAWIKSNQKKK